MVRTITVEVGESFAETHEQLKEALPQYDALAREQYEDWLHELIKRLEREREEQATMISQSHVGPSNVDEADASQPDPDDVETGEMLDVDPDT